MDQVLNLLFYYALITVPSVLWSMLAVSDPVGETPGRRRATPGEKKLFGLALPLLGPVSLFALMVTLAHKIGKSVLQPGDAQSLAMFTGIVAMFAAPIIFCNLNDYALSRRLRDGSQATEAPLGKLTLAAVFMLLSAVPLSVYGAWGNYRDGKIDSTQEMVSRRTGNHYVKVHMAAQDLGAPAYASISALLLFFASGALMIYDEKKQNSK